MTSALRHHSLDQQRSFLSWSNRISNRSGSCYFKTFALYLAKYQGNADLCNLRIMQEQEGCPELKLLEVWREQSSEEGKEEKWYRWMLAREQRACSTIRDIYECAIAFPNISCDIIERGYIGFQKNIGLSKPVRAQMPCHRYVCANVWIEGSFVTMKG